MTAAFHSGGLNAQASAGVRAAARRIGAMIHPTIPPAAQHFLRQQRMVVAGTLDERGRVWASLLTGQPGFIQALDERTLRIAAHPLAGDPLRDNLRTSDEIGLLAIEFATRRRMRLNGKAEVRPDGNLYVEARQVYGNCSKYIQAREEQVDIAALPLPQAVRRAATLTKEQERWIAQADTFFIASFHPEGGADVSHRGGHPGFARIVNGTQLLWPDYAGNNLFQTLGNIAEHPQAGLLFLDFERGSTLQLTGTARVTWDAARAAEFAGAERVVEFRIEQTLAIAGASPLRWRLVEYSPFNPS